MEEGNTMVIGGQFKFLMRFANAEGPDVVPLSRNASISTDDTDPAQLLRHYRNELAFVEAKKLTALALSSTIKPRSTCFRTCSPLMGLQSGSPSD